MLKISNEKIKEETELSSGERFILLQNTSCREIVETWLAEGENVHLSSVIGVDNENSLQVLYYFMDRKDNTAIVLGIDLDLKNPKTESIGDLIGSSVYEGEATEMFGIEFVGNELANVFLPENWVGGYPLRKSWKKEDYFNE